MKESKGKKKAQQPKTNVSQPSLKGLIRPGALEVKAGAGKSKS